MATNSSETSTGRPTDNNVVTTVISDNTVSTAGRWARTEVGLFFQRIEAGGRNRLAHVNLDGSGLTAFGDTGARYDNITVEPTADVPAEP